MISSATEAHFPYRPGAVLRAFGADAETFLQGQFTNDLRNLSAGPVYGLWLDVKGKVLADSTIIRGASPDEFWIVSVASPAETLRLRLESFIIADDVAVEDRTTAWTGFALWGNEARAKAEALRGFLFPGRRSRAESWEWLVPAESAAAAQQALAASRELAREETERRRIEAGLAEVPRDIGPGDFANEGGLDGPAISYSKGCYLGQEIMARLKSKGRLRRRLARVAGPGSPPAVPAPLWRSGNRVGEVRSAASTGDGSGFLGLAMLPIGAAEGGKITLSPEDESGLRIDNV